MKPMDKTERRKAHERELRAAAIRVGGMDETDGHADRSIGTIIATIDCGLHTCDSGAIYDALVMLIDIRSVISDIPTLNTLSIKDVFAKMQETLVASRKADDPCNN